jgi:hypothetical protein
LGGIYINNECLYNVTTPCTDTDTAVYPSLEYSIRGTMTEQGSLPVTDYCYQNFVMEFYCTNTTSASDYADMYDCEGIGEVCVDGACVGSNVTGNCSDTDTTNLPSLNETQQGMVTITTLNGTTNYTDYCSGNVLTEYYCNHPNLPIASNTSYTCYTYGKDCVDGECVPRLNQTCSDSDSNNAKPHAIAGFITLQVNGIITYQANDSCYNSTILREYYCPDNETYSAFAQDCAVSGGTCVDSRCLYPDDEIGVSVADMTWCWDEGRFNWSCCTYAENSTKSMLCPMRVTGRYVLGGVATFIFENFIYFLILVVVFVLITPYIAPKLREQG